MRWLLGPLAHTLKGQRGVPFSSEGPSLGRGGLPDSAADRTTSEDFDHAICGYRLGSR